VNWTLRVPPSGESMPDHEPICPDSFGTMIPSLRHTEIQPEGVEDLSHIAALRWLALILTIAAVLRTVGLTYQLPIPSGPDNIDLVGGALRVGTGDLNPHRFTWPAAPFYFLAICYGVMFLACRALGITASTSEFRQWFFDDPSAFFLVTRLIMVATGLLSVVMIYRIGRQLSDRRRGLWAAAMLAVTPVEVIMCHYQKAEPLLVLTILLAWAAIVRWWQQDSVDRVGIAGAAIGLACAVKYNAALLVVPAAATWIHHASIAGRGLLRQMVLKRLVVGGLVLICTFLALNPYLLLDAREALRQLAGQKEFMQTATSPIHQTPVRSYLTILFPVAFGWMLYAIYGAGFVWLVVRSLRRHGSEAMMVLFVLFYAATMMTQKLVTPYYPLPMVPILALGAAGFCCQIIRKIRLASWGLGLALAGPAGTSLVMAYQLAMPGPSLQAEHWIKSNVPAGNRLAHRHWIPPLLPSTRERLGCYQWPQEPRVVRSQVDELIQKGVHWLVLTTRDVEGREDELFGPVNARSARLAFRVCKPEQFLRMIGGGIDVWEMRGSCAVPPLARGVSDPEEVNPARQLEECFEGGVILIGTDSFDVGRSVLAGNTFELATYWLVPPGDTRRLTIVGDLCGEGGYLAHLSQQFAYGIDEFARRPSSRPCTVIHRLVLRPGYRAKPGDYTVRVGLRDPVAQRDLSIVKGPHAGHRFCELERITVRR